MIDYVFKTPPREHQARAFELYRDKPFHAHLWEQRVGKTWVDILTSAWLYSRGQISASLVIAPNGVHLDWALNQIPEHCPEHVMPQVGIWVSSPNAEQRKRLEIFMRSTKMGLRFCCMNIDALNTEKGLAFATKFLQTFRCKLTLDEGSLVKNIDAARTKALVGYGRTRGLKVLAPYRRLLNGTPITQSPLDLYPQFTFLSEDIFGPSHVAFRNRYAIIEMQGRMQGEVRKRVEKITSTFGTYPWGDLTMSEEQGAVTAGHQPLEDGSALEFIVKTAGRMVYELRWRRVGRSGEAFASGVEKMIFQPGQVYPVITGFRHLEELKGLIAPHSDRVLRSDCYDLPPKTYQKRPVEMSPKQRLMYAELRKQCITECRGRRMSTALAITKMLRLQQIVGGFFVPDLDQMTADEMLLPFDDLVDRWEARAKPLPIDAKNARVEALVSDVMERLPGKVIVWARFVAEIELIARRLAEELGGPSRVSLAYGSQKPEERQAAIRRFQTDDGVRAIVANPACKGVSRGQDLKMTSWELYYSNSFSLEDRLQSEDRPMSLGVGAVGIIDYLAPGTVDDKVIAALRDKRDVASAVVGDRLEEWI